MYLCAFNSGRLGNPLIYDLVRPYILICISVPHMISVCVYVCACHLYAPVKRLLQRVGWQVVWIRGVSLTHP